MVRCSDPTSCPLRLGPCSPGAAAVAVRSGSCRHSPPGAPLRPLGWLAVAGILVMPLLCSGGSRCWRCGSDPRIHRCGVSPALSLIPVFYGGERGRRARERAKGAAQRARAGPQPPPGAGARGRRRAPPERGGTGNRGRGGDVAFNTREKETRRPRSGSLCDWPRCVLTFWFGNDSGDLLRRGVSRGPRMHCGSAVSSPHPGTRGHHFRQQVRHL